MRLRLGRAASSVVNSLTVQLRLDLDLDLPLAGEEHAIGAGVEGGLAEEHEAAAGPGRLERLDDRLPRRRRRSEDRSTALTATRNW